LVLNRPDLTFRGLGLAHFKAAITANAWGKLRAGKDIPISARGHLGCFMK